MELLKSTRKSLEVGRKSVDMNDVAPVSIMRKSLDFGSTTLRRDLNNNNQENLTPTVKTVTVEEPWNLQE